MSKHKCKNYHMPHEAFERKMNDILAELTTIINSYQEEFRIKNICENDFLSFISSASVSMMISTMQFVVHCSDNVSMEELTKDIIIKLITQAGGRCVDLNAVAAMEEKKFSTVN